MPASLPSPLSSFLSSVRCVQTRSDPVPSAKKKKKKKYSKCSPLKNFPLTSRKMSDTVAEVKETVATPEKEVAKKVEKEVAKKVEKEAAAEKVEEKKETNGEAKKNGVSKESKDEESSDDKPVENGDCKEAEEDDEASGKAKKRTSDVVDGEKSADKDASPAKKSKVEEKAENGSTETETAA